MLEDASAHNEDAWVVEVKAGIGNTLLPPALQVAGAERYLWQAKILRCHGSRLHSAEILALLLQPLDAGELGTLLLEQMIRHLSSLREPQSPLCEETDRCLLPPRRLKRMWLEEHQHRLLVSLFPPQCRFSTHRSPHRNEFLPPVDTTMARMQARVDKTEHQWY